MDLDLASEDQYQEYNFEQKKISKSQVEDQVKLQKLCQRREDSCQSEIVLPNLQIENTIRDKKDLQTSINQSFDGSIIHQLGDSSAIPTLRQTEYNTNRQDYQIVFKQINNVCQNMEQQQESFPILSINKQQTSTQSQFLNLDKSRQQSKRLTYTTSPNVRKDSKIQNIKAIIQKKRNSGPNKIDEIQLLSKIKIRMCQFYKQFTQSGRKMNLINPLIQKSINDKSDYIECGKASFFQQKFDSLENILKKCKLIESIPLFNPSHPICFFAQIFLCFLNCIFFIFFCILTIFNPSFENQKELQMIITSFWFIEILVKINTSVYIYTDLIQSRNLIIKLYLRHNAVYDLIPFISLQLIQQHQIMSILFKVLCFIKLKNVVEDLCDFQKQICMAIKKYYYVQLFNLIAKVFLIGHCISCLWYLLGYYEHHYLQEEENWLNKGISIDGTWWKLYLSSLFWSLTLMTTGSNEASTTLETFFTSFIMLFTSIMFCYFLNAIGNILADIDEEERQMKKDINIINSFMRNHNISRNLQRRVNKDLEHFYEKNYRKLKEDNESVLQKISPHIKEQINKECYKKYIDKIEFISKNFSIETIEKLCQNIEELYFTPNQIILNENGFDDLSLMYVIDGQGKQKFYNEIIVELNRQCMKDPGVTQIISVLEKDSLIGQNSFLTGQQRNAGAKSKSFSTILQITRENFINIIKQNEEDFQRFCQIRDNMMMYKNYYNIGIKCSICKKFSHYSQDCPLTHFDKDSAFIKAKMFEKVKQNREKYKRREVKFVNSISVQKRIAEAACFFADTTLLLQVRINQQIGNGDSDDMLNESDHEEEYSQIATHSGHIKASQCMQTQQFEADEDRKQKQGIELFNVLETYCDGKRQRLNSTDNRNKTLNSKDIKEEQIDSRFRGSIKDEQVSTETRNNKVVFSLHSNSNDFQIDSKGKTPQMLKDEQYSSNRINMILKEEGENITKTKSLEHQNSELSVQRPPVEQITAKSVSSYMDQNSFLFPETVQPKMKKQSIYKYKRSDTNQSFERYNSKIYQEYRKLIQAQSQQDNATQVYFPQQSPWIFDRQKDYEIYFPEGNLAISLMKYNRFVRRTQSVKKSPRKISKK